MTTVTIIITVISYDYSSISSCQNNLAYHTCVHMYIWAAFHGIYWHDARVINVTSPTYSTIWQESGVEGTWVSPSGSRAPRGWCKYATGSRSAWRPHNLGTISTLMTLRRDILRVGNAERWCFTSCWPEQAFWTNNKVNSDWRRQDARFASLLWSMLLAFFTVHRETTILV